MADRQNELITESANAIAAFRTSVRGFNKDDVLTYIDGLLGQLKAAEDRAQLAEQNAEQKLSKAHEDEAGELRARIASLEKDIAEASGSQSEAQRIAELESNVDELQSALDESLDELTKAQSKIKELESDKTAADSELARVRDELSSANEALASLRAETASLKERLVELDELDSYKARVAELTEKLRKTEASLGSAMMDAKVFSDQMIDRARTKTGAIFADASRRSAHAADISDDIIRLLSQVISQSMASFDRINELTNELSCNLRQFSKDAADGTADRAVYGSVSADLSDGD